MQLDHKTCQLPDHRQLHPAAGWHCGAEQTRSRRRPSAGCSTATRRMLITPCTSLKGWRKKVRETTRALQEILWPGWKTPPFLIWGVRWRLQPCRCSSANNVVTHTNILKPVTQVYCCLSLLSLSILHCPLLVICRTGDQRNEPDGVHVAA